MSEEQNLLAVERKSATEPSPEAPPSLEKESSSVEQAEAPQTAEVQEQKPSTEAVKEVAEAPTSAPAAVQQTPAQKDQTTQDIEELLAEDLADLFLSLPADKKAPFKQAGEEAAVQIKTLMESGKAKAKTVLDIIRNWLRMVPGVNKFFLDQEAKIKTDKIMDYYESRSEQDQNTI